MKKIQQLLRIYIAQQYFFFLGNQLKAKNIFDEKIERSVKKIARSIPLPWRIARHFSKKECAMAELLLESIPYVDASEKKLWRLYRVVRRGHIIMNEEIMCYILKNTFNFHNWWYAHCATSISESGKLKKVFEMGLQYIVTKENISYFADYFLEQYVNAHRKYNSLYFYAGYLIGAIDFYRKLGDTSNMLVCVNYLRKSSDEYYHPSKLHNLLNLYMEIGLEKSQQYLMEIVTEIEKDDRYDNKHTITVSSFFAMYCRSLLPNAWDDSNPIWQLSHKLPLYLVPEKVSVAS